MLVKWLLGNTVLEHLGTRKTLHWGSEFHCSIFVLKHPRRTLPKVFPLFKYRQAIISFKNNFSKTLPLIITLSLNLKGGTRTKCPASKKGDRYLGRGQRAAAAFLASEERLADLREPGFPGRLPDLQSFDPYSAVSCPQPKGFLNVSLQNKRKALMVMTVQRSRKFAPFPDKNN